MEDSHCTSYPSADPDEDWDFGLALGMGGRIGGGKASSGLAFFPVSFLLQAFVD